MSNKLVAYFSATGTTAKLAERLASVVGADVHRIVPETPYTLPDLDWNDKTSRSTIEMNDPSSRPAIAASDLDLSGYDEVFVGFPIWWYTAPKIILTFLESYDFSGKTVVVFATSGGSSIGGTDADIAPSIPGADLRPGKVFSAGDRADTLASWAEGLGM